MVHWKLAAIVQCIFEGDLKSNESAWISKEIGKGNGNKKKSEFIFEEQAVGNSINRRHVQGCHREGLMTTNEESEWWLNDKIAFSLKAKRSFHRHVTYRKSESFASQVMSACIVRFFEDFSDLCEDLLGRWARHVATATSVAILLGAMACYHVSAFLCPLQRLSNGAYLSLSGKTRPHPGAKYKPWPYLFWSDLKWLRY